MIFYRGDDEYKLSHSWKFGCCALTLSNSRIYSYRGTNHSRAFEVLWLVPIDNFIEVNFSKLTDSNQIFRNDFVWIHYHLGKISQIIECKIFVAQTQKNFVGLSPTNNTVGLSPTDYTVSLSRTDYTVGLSPTDYAVSLSPTYYTVGLSFTEYTVGLSPIDHTVDLSIT